MSSIDFDSVKIVKANTISGDEKKTGSVTGTLAYYSFGGVSDLWGLGWTADDINNSTFGVACSFLGNGLAGINYTTYYLQSTNYGFAIPAGATINGIVAGIKAQGLVSTFSTAFVDVSRITVYYTEAAAGPANLKSLDTNLKANIKSIDGVLIANAKSYDTIV